MRARKGDWIQTFQGGQFWPLDPIIEEVNIYDIAHALSCLCRFNGHVREFYSVAQHSLFVSLHCDPIHAIDGLLHDAAEAYLVDMPKPVKRHLEGFGEIEAAIEKVIAKKFFLELPMPADVKRADLLALATEKRDLMHNPPPAEWELLPTPAREKIIPMLPREAEAEFISRFVMLCHNT